MSKKFYAALALSATLCIAAGIAGAQDAAAPAPETKEAKVDHHNDPNIKKADLGTTTIGTLKIEKITQEGAVKAGAEGAFDIIIGEGATPPKAMRAWIGVASAEGSVKTKLESEPDRHYHSHVEVPKTLPEGSMYWLEVEPETGPAAKTSFKFFTE